jgi:DASS family divalent anion:Na+ symporter
MTGSTQAWDTLFWFAVLVGMSGQLNGSGVIKYFADVVGGKLTALNMGWQPVFGLLNIAYFGLHYMFASQTAHVGALYAAFLAMMLSAGERPLLLVHRSAHHQMTGRC